MKVSVFNSEQFTSAKSRAAPRTSSSTAIHKMSHCCPNRHADELQQLAEGNSSKGFFAAIKHVHGPQKTAISPIRDAKSYQMLTEKPAIVSRWREYFTDLLNCPAIAREEALLSVYQYRVHEGMANPPTLEDILAAIKS